MAEQVSQSNPQPNLELAPEYIERCANNLLFEASVWDLKLLFGQLDQNRHNDRVIISRHTAVTIPWMQAKIMAYFLVVNLALHQSEDGFIEVPERILPPKPQTEGPGINPDLAKYMTWIHEQFFGPNPYVPPGVDAAKL